MGSSRMGRPLRILAATALGASFVAGAAIAQDQPRSGGVVKFATVGEPPSYDCHTFTSITQFQYLAPHYSTLLKIDPNNYPTVVPSVGKEWTISPDGLVYTVKLNTGVKFHDGSELTSEDVKATFERVATPPEGVASVRRGQFTKLASIEAPAPDTVVFTLKEPAAGFLTTLGSPWHCLYSKAKLAADPNYPGKVVMGTGPFVFKDYQVGAIWEGTKFADYFEEGKPYLDGFQAMLTTGQSVANSISGQQVDAIFRLISKPERSRIESVRGDSVVFQDTPATSVTLIHVNTKKKPFDDVRVRRALSLAIDRDAGIKVLGDYSQRYYNVIFREGHELAPTPEEYKAILGFSGDIEAQRAEAKKLLEEAGVPNLSLTLLSPDFKVPYEPLAVFFIDQWRRIGVNVTFDPQPTATQIARMRSGDFDLGLDFNAPSGDDPTEVMAKYVPGNPANYTGFEDAEMVELYSKQDAATDPAERARLIKEFVARFVDEQYYITTFNTEREVVLDKKVRGWRVPPSYSVGLDLSNVWLAE
jgi:peptide/nickel transport system substrate-binding protein